MLQSGLGICTKNASKGFYFSFAFLFSVVILFFLMTIVNSSDFNDEKELKLYREFELFFLINFN